MAPDGSQAYGLVRTRSLRSLIRLAQKGETTISSKSNGQKFGNYRNGEPQIMRKLGTFGNYFNSTGCEREWGFRQYRVVIIQRTDARREAAVLWLSNEKVPAQNVLAYDRGARPGRRGWQYLQDAAR